MKIIKGSQRTRTEQGGFPVYIDGKLLGPARSQKIRNHSPDGWNWGYNGSGPAQLALGLLLEFTDEETARRLYQKFKCDVIAGLSEDFELKVADVKDWIKKKQMIKIGDKVKLAKKGKIGHCFELGESYEVRSIREEGRTLVVTDGNRSQIIETECFQPVVFEEIIYDE